MVVVDIGEEDGNSGAYACELYINSFGRVGLMLVLYFYVIAVWTRLRCRLFPLVSSTWAIRS